MTNLTELDNQYRKALIKYHEATRSGDASATAHYGRECDRLNEIIDIECAKVEYDFDEWD